MAASSARRKIRRTAVIHKFRTAPAYGPVDVPVPANAEEIDWFGSTRRPELFQPFQSFSPCNPLARVFDDLLTRRNHFLCEHTKTVNRGAMNLQTKTRSPRVNVMEHSSARVALRTRRRTQKCCHRIGAVLRFDDDAFSPQPSRKTAPG